MIEKKTAQQPDAEMKEIIETLKELKDDKNVPRNVKTKIEQTIHVLDEQSEQSIKINKALHYLDEIGDDSNLQPYSRTQIWNIVSLLEKI